MFNFRRRGPLAKIKRRENVSQMFYMYWNIFVFVIFVAKYHRRKFTDDENFQIFGITYTLHIMVFIIFIRIFWSVIGIKAKIWKKWKQLKHLLVVRCIYVCKRGHVTFLAYIFRMIVGVAVCYGDDGVSFSSSGLYRSSKSLICSITSGLLASGNLSSQSVFSLQRVANFVWGNKPNR